MATITVPKKHVLKPATWKKSWRQNTVKKQVKATVRKKIKDDKEFVDCYARTCPWIQELFAGKVQSLEEEELVQEAEALYGAIGSSKIVKVKSSPSTDKYVSKYKNSFSFQHEVEPPDITNPVMQYQRSSVCTPAISPEGWLPTCHQFQHQDMESILNRYPKGNTYHGPDHICRCLILAKAIAQFYLEHGQVSFKPGDTTPEEQKNLKKDDPKRWKAAVGALKIPKDNEIDIAMIMFAVAFHDSGRKGDGKDEQEHESGRNAYYYLRRIGYSIEYAAEIARIIVKNEENPTGPSSTVALSRTEPDNERGRNSNAHADNTIRTNPAPKPRERPTTLNEMITHDVDTLDIQRLVSERNYEKDRVGFLKKTEFHEGLGSDFSADNEREALIADARKLARMSCVLSYQKSLGEVRGQQKEDLKNEIAEIMNNYEFKCGKYTEGNNRSLLSYYMELERLLIDKIFKDPNAFPFLYKYYFRKCFKPQETYWKELNSEQRLALIRCRLYALDRNERDRLHAESTFDGIKDEFERLKHSYREIDQGDFPEVEKDKIKDIVFSAPLTINVKYTHWGLITNSLKDIPSPCWKQFWEIFVNENSELIGSRDGASTDTTARNKAEQENLNYKTHFKMLSTPGRFTRSDRPNYTGVNGGYLPLGAVVKYGNTAIWLDHSVKKYATYTFRDTFGESVKPDSVAWSKAPWALFRKIHPMQGFNPDVFKVFVHREQRKNSPMAQKALGHNDMMYIEAQIHGPIRYKNDIKAIVIEVTSTDGSLDQQIKTFADKHDIIVRYTAFGLDAVYKKREDAKAASENKQTSEPPANDAIFRRNAPQTQPVQQQQVHQPQPVQQQPQQPVQQQPQQPVQQQPQQPEQQTQAPTGQQVGTCRLCGCRNFIPLSPSFPNKCKTCSHDHPVKPPKPARKPPPRPQKKEVTTAKTSSKKGCRSCDCPVFVRDPWGSKFCKKCRHVH